MTTKSAETGTTTQPLYRVIGKRPIRHDGYDKVTGRALYGADIRVAGMAYGKILRSPHAHARIRDIDTSKAEALRGVRAVVTARDFPDMADTPIDYGEPYYYNAKMVADNLLACQKVLYVGHAVAAVAADDSSVAEEALKLIHVDYDVLPAAIDIHEAMAEGAPLVHENMSTRTLAAPYTRGSDTGVHSNIASYVQFSRGEVERSFAESDVVVEQEHHASTVHQGYIEPHAAVASWSPEGRLTIWCSSQGHFQIRQQTAAIVGLPESRVKVIPTEIGGGFGGKLTSYLEPVVAVLSRKSGRPVKIVMSRKEVLEATGPTAGAYMRTKIGATKDGKITAVQQYLAFEAGAYPGSPVGAAAATGFGSYNVENLLVDAYDVVCNKPRTAPYRAPGAPQAVFAIESVIDEVAEKLGMDPLEFRLKNATKEGDKTPSGLPFPRIDCVELEETMKAHPHYRAPLKGANRGRGVAVGFWANAGMSSSATINVNADGTISLITGSVDIGGQRAALAMQAAEVLGLSAEAVMPTVGDTDSVGWTYVTGGSRTTFATGIAVIRAAEDVKRQMIERAALLFDGSSEEIQLRGNLFCHFGALEQDGPHVDQTASRSISFKDLAAKLQETGGPVTASASATPKQIGPSFGGGIVDVEVDPETGRVTILRYTAFQSAGKAIHPSYVEGQLQGGTVQGIGWALNEEYFYDEQGRMLNSSLLDYRMPTSLDVPMVDPVLIEVPNPGHPFGVRGVGEISIVAPMAAIANAIYHAVGVRMTRLPMNPGAILDAMAEKATQADALKNLSSVGAG